MQEFRHETVEYYLFFTKTKLNHWIFKFLDSEIQHVYAVTRNQGNWVVINPLRSHTQIEVIPVDECIHPRCIDPDAAMLAVRTTINSDNVVHGVGVLSCVSTVKSLLGIRKRFIFTPFQLFKYLQKGINHG